MRELQALPDHQDHKVVPALSDLQELLALEDLVGLLVRKVHADHKGMAALTVPPVRPVQEALLAHPVQAAHQAHQDLRAHPVLGPHSLRAFLMKG